jgi:hypothetical protein
METNMFWMVHNPKGNPSKVRYASRSLANEEAKILAALQPGDQFYVLETISAFVTEAPKVTEVRLLHTEAPPNVG